MIWGLPNHPDDIPLLEGSSWAIRVAADRLVLAAEQLGAARQAAQNLSAVERGDIWQGEAWAAFISAMAQRPLPTHIDNAVSAMHVGADRLRWFAGRFDEYQGRLHWCRARLRNLGLYGGDIPNELIPEVQAIQREAQDARADHRWALGCVADTFDHLDDATIFAKPPPSSLQRLGGAAMAVWTFGGDVLEGIGRGLVEMGQVLAFVVIHLNPIALPHTFAEVIAHRDEILGVLRFAMEHPWDFAKEIGKAFLDWDTFAEDGFGVWLGKRIPDLILAFATMGASKAGTGASAAVRGFRMVGRSLGAADDAADIGVLARLGLHLDRVPTAARPGGGAGLGSGGLGQRLLEVDALDSIGDFGAMTRTDSRLGSVMLRGDALPGFGPARQGPGVLADGVRIKLADACNLLGDRTGVPGLARLGESRRLNSVVGNLLTNGHLSQLRLADALLVGAPALGSTTYTATLGVTAAVNVASEVAGAGNVARDVWQNLERRAGQ